MRTPENASSQPGLEFVVADALRREVLRRSGAELVEDADDADWVVSGRVLPLRIVPASLSPVVLTLEYQLTLEVDLRARAPDGARWPATRARCASPSGSSRAPMPRRSARTAAKRCAACRGCSPRASSTALDEEHGG